MEIRNGFSFRTAIRARWYLVALGCVSLSAHAQADFGQQIWWKADHNSFSAEVNRVLGTPSATYPATGTPNVNGAKLSNTAGAWPTVAMKTNLPVPGKSAPIDVIAKVKPASVGAAFGRLATKVGPLSTVIALASFASEIGFLLKGDGTIEKPMAGSCTVAPCYEFQYTRASPSYATGWQKSIAQVQARDIELYNAARLPAATVCPNFNGSITTMVASTVRSSNYDIIFRSQACNGSSTYPPNDSNLQTVTPSSRTRTPDTGVQTEPATQQEFADAVTSKTGFATTSAISAAIAESIKNGEVIDYDPAAVSGPASKVGNSSTTNNPDGTVTTVTVNHNYTYNGPKVTVTTTTTTSTVNPATGATTTATKTDSEAVPDVPPVEEEKNPCDLNPDALGCAELDTPSGEIPKYTETIGYTAENVFGDGSCPSNLTANIATLAKSVTVWDWEKTCSLALPLRALVLGLASFAALLIVMPGGNKT